MRKDRTHMLQYDLTHYHLPQREKGLVFSYCCNLLLCFSTKEFTTGYIRVEKGIITGCTISVILFVLDMNLILKAVEEETRGPKVAPGILVYKGIRISAPCCSQSKLDAGDSLL